MITRRLFVGAFIALAAFALSSAELPAQAPKSSDPPGIVNAIYERVTKGNGDGVFLVESSAAKAKYFSKSLIALWTKADAHTPKGDIGPIDFDLATNSQAPSVNSFVATTEKLDSGTATIAVKMTRDHEVPRANPADDVVRYDFVRDGGHWKIDDIRGATDGKPWSLRALLTFSLKN
jgi:hypothetical protein